MVRDFEASGLTGAEYSRKIGIKYSTFCSRTFRAKWAEKVRTDKQTSGIPAGAARFLARKASAHATTTSLHASTPAPAFHEIRLTGEESPPSVTVKSEKLLTVTLSGGIKIEGCVISDIIALVTALKGAC